MCLNFRRNKTLSNCLLETQCSNTVKHFLLELAGIVVVVRLKSSFTSIIIIIKVTFNSVKLI